VSLLVAAYEQRPVKIVRDVFLGFTGLNRVTIFLLATTFRPTLRPTQPPIQRIRGGGALSPGIMRSDREADHSPLIPRLRLRGSVPPFLQYVLMCLIKQEIRLHGVVLS
jgi:hypothetical protein